MLQKPEANEYAPYYEAYVHSVPDGDLLEILDKQVKETVNLLKNLNEDQASFRYAQGKWTIKEVIGHVTDTERIMGYRLLCISRGETAMLPGYDDNQYVKEGNFNRFNVKELLEQLSIVRQNTLGLLKSLDDESLMQRGNANGTEVTARAIAYIIAGHELHHRNLIKERYMKAEGYNKGDGNGEI
ncbi:DinB family protein [Bacillus sp. ISL-47]|uniref:DinB family protein n=1 Tax=Bacillus sp. ISL-47 TaxID=2819130 RepID=UPI001BE97A35|nr:DinB family protein [Bacillus sp. ISL-47]MBT2690213.1 DinB family protein [Bacillus sp. ISL-47]MBT2710338.1 DinB family protein [Pseudomonas sp. ISL-84]